MTKKVLINKIVFTSVFAALSTVLYLLLKFPLPFIFPAFLEIQFSNLPAIIGGFILGPFWGVLIVCVRTLIALPFSGTMFVGELADFIIGLAVVITSSLIYKKNHTRKGGLIALIVSSVVWVVSAVIANYAVLVPFYIELFWKGDVSSFIQACAIIPGIDETNYMMYYILLAALPFNLLISTIVNVVTFLVYKKVSIFIHTQTEKKEKQEQ